MSIRLNFNSTRICEYPYKHAWIPRMFPMSLNNNILKWLEQDLPWQFTQTDFYRQFEFSFRDVTLPANMEFLVSKETLSVMGDWLKHTFESPDIELVDVVAHLLKRGHGVGVHNDYREDGETIRLLLQLGRNVKGGMTALCKSQSANSIRRIVRPIHGTAFAFSISPITYHAVSPVKFGHRFTIVFSFRPIK